MSVVAPTRITSSELAKQAGASRTHATQQKGPAPQKLHHTSLFRITPRNVIRGKGVCKTLSLAERCFLIGLMDICGENRECFYTLEHLAEEVATTRATASRYISKLKSLSLITVHKDQHHILHIKVCTEMIWADNTKLYPRKEKAPFFEPNLVPNSTGQIPNWNGTSSPNRAQSDNSRSNLQHRERNISEKDTTGERKRRTSSPTPTDQTPVPAPPADVFPEEKNVGSEETPAGKAYAQEIKDLAQQVHHYTFLPITTDLLNFLEVFTSKHPDVDVVLAAQDARSYANRKRNGKLELEHYTTTCTRQEEFRARREQHSSSSSQQHKPGSPGFSSDSLPSSPPPVSKLVPCLSKEEAETLASEIVAQGQTRAYAIDTEVRSSKTVEGAWWIKVIWENGINQEPPRVMTREQWYTYFEKTHSLIQRVKERKRR